MSVRTSSARIDVADVVPSNPNCGREMLRPVTMVTTRYSIRDSTHTSDSLRALSP